jgi:flagellar motor switch protein FliN/FliY
MPEEEPTAAEEEGTEKAEGKQWWSSDSKAEDASEGKVEVQPAALGELSDGPQGAGLNLDLILDISMPVTVELGKTSVSVKELLKLNSGSVVQLDRMAGEPVDLMVRGVCFARGEVVVVDNCFGIRITEVINPQSRIQQLAK